MDKKELTCSKCGYVWPQRGAKEPLYCPLCKQARFTVAEVVAMQKQKRSVLVKL